MRKSKIRFSRKFTVTALAVVQTGIIILLAQLYFEPFYLNGWTCGRMSVSHIAVGTISHVGMSLFLSVMLKMLMIEIDNEVYHGN